jgi:hypothetical protein
LSGVLSSREQEEGSFTESEYSGGSSLFGSDTEGDSPWEAAAPAPVTAPQKRHPTDLKSMLEDTLRAKPGDASAAEEEERCDRPSSRLTATNKVANREIRVWHGATENGPCMMDKSKTSPRRDCRSCRYLTLCRGVLDLSIIQ